MAQTFMRPQRKPCSVSGCEKLSAAHGLCGKHYMRFRKHGSTDNPDDPEKRFWRMVDVRGPDDCWPWRGWTNQNGHGQFHLGGRVRVFAHVYAWTLKNGPLPPDKPCGLHRCDNPPCANPDHIFPGTVQDNAADRHAKGRDAKGDGHGMTKIPEARIHEIFERFAAGETYASIAKDFGVATITISKIRQGTRRQGSRTVP